MTGIDLIAAERARQIAKGYTTDHDAEHGASGLIRAAEGYLSGLRLLIPWPTDRRAWEVQTQRERLVKAGALIAAALDEFDGVVPSFGRGRTPTSARCAACS